MNPLREKYASELLKAKLPLENVYGFNRVEFWRRLTPDEGSLFRKIKNQFKFFSRREQEVLNLILKGCPNKVISANLFISYQTTKNHTSNILHKMNVLTRIEIYQMLHDWFS